MKTCVLTADRARARLFQLVVSSDPWQPPMLREVADFVHPSRVLRDGELYSTTKPGTHVNRLSAHAQPRSFDDHRDGSRLESDRRFAARILQGVPAQLAACRARRLVLCAPPRMLGLLRSAMADRPLEVDVETVDSDLTGLTPPQLTEHLTTKGLLPGRPAVAR